MGDGEADYWKNGQPATSSSGRRPAFPDRRPDVWDWTRLCSLRSAFGVFRKVSVVGLEKSWHLSVKVLP